MRGTSLPAPIELLAPARTAEIARVAIRHGADAVYIGASSHGARAAATNPVTDIAPLVAHAHDYGVRVYVTLNTLVYEHETASVTDLVWQLWSAGVDALIVQDLGFLTLPLPPIALHASTQTDVRTPQKARMLADAGFSQLVLPREFSLDEIATVHSQVPGVVLETFIHGALCVSYSGDCQASLLTTGRSANRGECAQICRLPYDLTDGSGKTILQGKHLLSLRDMNRLARLGDMLDAGVTSFKIEGRLKDATYVKQTVGAYRKALDSIIEANPHRWRRSSDGTVTLKFQPDLEETFNRGYTEYFLTDTRPAAGSMATMLTPKSTGTPVADVVSAPGGTRITVKLRRDISNGDGLGYFDGEGRFRGFRVNRAEGPTLFAALPQRIPAGTTLFRNRSTETDRALSAETATRDIGVSATLTYNPRTAMLSLRLTDDSGAYATSAIHTEGTSARTPQHEQHRRIVAKLGDTPFVLTDITDKASGLFVPASTLTELRRRAAGALLSARRATYRYEYRRPDTLSPQALAGVETTYHDNVANSHAERFYTTHGAVVRQHAAEVETPATDTPLCVMTTRYCLRRELGACLRESGGGKLRGPLRLRASGNVAFLLDFDCHACRMRVLKE